VTVPVLGLARLATVKLGFAPCALRGCGSAADCALRHGLGVHNRHDVGGSGARR
jgi:hypothetical protein